MAFQMSYTTDQGFDCPNSYWIPVQINLCKSERSGNVLFYGYKDQAARTALRPPVGSKSYPIGPEEYEAYFDAEVIQPEGMDQFKAAYLLALATKEGPVPEGEDTRVSFFDTATEV